MSTGTTAAGGGFKLPPSLERTLPNGARLFAAEHHGLPLVEIEVIIRVGSAHDPVGKEGLACLVADLLRKGTAARSAREIADAVDFVGGSLSASCDPDATRVSAEFLFKDLELGLELVADTLRNPAFTQEEVDRQKAETISELKAVKENPGLLASRRFFEILYDGHPYAHPTHGSEKSVASIAREDVQRFYQANYTPDNVIAVVVGDFRAAELLSRVESKLSGWKGSAASRKKIPDPPRQQGRTIYLLDKPDATQSQIRIGGVGAARTDTDYTLLQVANTILGGGFTSRLVEEIRVNRGLSYGVSSRFTSLVKPGPFAISTFSKNATTKETIQVALDLLEEFRTGGPTPEEMDKARKYLKGQFAIGHQTPDALADALADISFYGLPRDYYDTYLDRISSATVADIKRVASRLPSDNRIILVLGQAEAIRKDLESLGQVRTAPLSAE